MSQQTNDFKTWEEALREISKHDYGKPSKDYPRFISFQNRDPKFPSDGILETGPKAIRAFWNDKNLRKRKN